MDILDHAIELENNGRKFYLESASLAKTPAVRAILESLAEDEVGHARFLIELKSNATVPYAPSASFSKIEGILKESKLSTPEGLAETDDVREVIQKAIDFEDKARLHYDNEAFITLRPEARETLRLLAREEERHHQLLCGLLKYLDTPENLLETQEFHWRND